MKIINCIVALLLTATCIAQQQKGILTVSKIMRDPKWMGTSPANVSWSYDGRCVYFNWNPEKAITDSLYMVNSTGTTIQKTNFSQRENILRARDVTWNNNRSSYTYERDGDIFVSEIKSGTTRRITQTEEIESNPRFSFSDTKIVYTSNQNLFAWDIASGLTVQLSNFQRGNPPRNWQETYLTPRKNG